MYKVTYNDTNELFVFKDRYYKTYKGALKFIQKIAPSCQGKVSLKDLDKKEWIDIRGLI